MALSPNAHVLDVGCGPGEFPIWLREHGHAGGLIGLDRSPAMVAEGRAASGDIAPPIDWIHADATALPIADGACDWAVARHMLYHVPDKAAALRELARVIRPTGAALLTTNSARSLPHIRSLMRDLFRTFELPTGREESGFTIENAKAILGVVFQDVRETVVENALVFRSVAPIAAYIASTFSLRTVPEDAALRSEMRGWLVEEAERRLAAMGGVWRDPKYVGFYVCRSR